MEEAGGVVVETVEDMAEEVGDMVDTEVDGWVEVEALVVMDMDTDICILLTTTTTTIRLIVIHQFIQMIYIFIICKVLYLSTVFHEFLIYQSVNNLKTFSRLTTPIYRLQV